MNYSELSDFQINKLVAEKLGVQLEQTTFFSNPPSDDCFALGRMVGNTFKVVDYCNNPSDAWPIILENKIDIEHPDERYGSIATCTARDICGSPIQVDYGIDENPLRAAMIVFLMMGDK